MLFGSTFVQSSDTFCWMGVPGTPGQPSSQNMQLQIAAIVSPMLPHGEYKREVRDSAFCQLTLVLVQLTITIV